MRAFNMAALALTTVLGMGSVARADEWRWVEGTKVTEQRLVVIPGHWETRCEVVAVPGHYETRERVLFSIRGHKTTICERVWIAGTTRNVERRVWIAERSVYQPVCVERPGHWVKVCDPRPSTRVTVRIGR